MEGLRKSPRFIAGKIYQRIFLIIPKNLSDNPQKEHSDWEVRRTRLVTLKPILPTFLEQVLNQYHRAQY